MMLLLARTVAIALGLGGALFARTTSGQELSIPYVETKLDNGLVVILSEDHSVPQVAVNTTYLVGSRVEAPGHTGFAHLFEHLMFMGTRNAPREKFDTWMEEAGGTNNAWTAEDRTDYYDVAPPTALPLLLWLEADRMRNLGQDVDRSKVDLQREVVLNERRQRIENQPYGVEDLVLPELLWPPGHPYHHPVIGSPPDLRAAGVGEVKQFFARWYDPSNASIVVAGDFDASRAMVDIRAWFGAVPTEGKPPQPETPAVGAFRSTLTSVVRKTVPDAVELAKVTLAWQSPPHFATGDADLDLLASILAKGQAGRLYESLVHDLKIAQSVSAEQDSRELGSQFLVEAIVSPGVDPAHVEKALFERIADVRDHEVSAEELERARSGYETGFVDRLQSIPERASLLNMYQAELGDPGFVQRDLDRYLRASRADLLEAARDVLRPDAVVVLTIVPKKEAR